MHATIKNIHVSSTHCRLLEAFKMGFQTFSMLKIKETKNIFFFNH
jgi:hypothetical protein